MKGPRFWDNEDLLHGFGSFLVGAGLGGMTTWCIWGDPNQPHFFTWALTAATTAIVGLVLQSRAIKVRMTRGDAAMQAVEALAGALRRPDDIRLIDDPGYRAALLADVDRNDKNGVVLDPRAAPFMPEGLRQLIDDGWVRKLRTPTGALKFELTQEGRHALDSGQTGKCGERQ